MKVIWCAACDNLSVSALYSTTSIVFATHLLASNKHHLLESSPPTIDLRDCDYLRLIATLHTDSDAAAIMNPE